MTKKRVPQILRRLVKERAQGYCEYCVCPDSCATQEHSLEHIIPGEQGGGNTADNLALSCQGCNNIKYTKTHALDQVSKEIVPLFHPRQNNWHEHFASSSDQLLMIGLTPTGRATIEALRLNRQGAINLRRLLWLDGKHPPPHRSSS
jgi:HNH endonuclease